LDAFTLPEIIGVLRAAIDRAPRLFPLPRRLFADALRMIGKGELWERLGASLVANPAKLIAAGWQPALDTRAGLAAMMRSAGHDR
jgi:hypothetical protein